MAVEEAHAEEAVAGLVVAADLTEALAGGSMTTEAREATDETPGEEGITGNIFQKKFYPKILAKNRIFTSKSKV